MARSKYFYYKLFVVILIGISFLHLGCSTPAIHAKYKSETIVLWEKPHFQVQSTPQGELEICCESWQETTYGSVLTYEEGYRPFPVGLKVAEILLLFPLSLGFYPLLIVFSIAFLNWRFLVVPFLFLYPLKTVFPSYGGRTEGTGKVFRTTWNYYFQEGVTKKPYGKHPIKIWKIAPERAETVRTNSAGKLHLPMPWGEGELWVEPEGSPQKFCVQYQDGKIKNIFTYLK